MKTARTVAMSAIGVLFMLATDRPAYADYNGLTIEKHTSVQIAGSGYDVYRVYANFTDPGDRLVALFGGQTTQPIIVQSRNSNDSGFGNAFFNVPGNIKAPIQFDIDNNPAMEWDTFVTIGTPVYDLVPGGDMTWLTPGFVGIGGTNWTHYNQAWFLPPTTGNPPTPPIQSVAGWTGDGDLANRVMLMQLTVSAGDNVRGWINLAWFKPVAFGGLVVNEEIQTFNSFIPAPGALMLFGAAGLLSIRRRRAG